MPAPAPRPPFWYRSLATLLTTPGSHWGQRGEAEGAEERARGGGTPASLWVHAASVGETVAALPVVREIRRRRPTESVYLTSVTPGGRAQLRRAFPDLPVGALPFDAPGPVARAVSRVSPQRAILFETELWPEWMGALLASNTRLAVANARLSPASLRAYRWLPGVFRPLARRLSAVAAQSEEDAARWKQLGVPEERVMTTGNTKLDAEPLGSVEPAEARRRARAELGLEPDAFWVTVGSLRPGEEVWLERAIGEAGRGVRYLIVPRHPEAWSGRTAVERHGACRWLGRLGVLDAAYAAADVALVGGTFARYGGHNPAEPARLGVPLLLGPHTENHREIAERLLQGGGARLVASPQALSAAIAAWRDDEDARRSAGVAARRIVASLQGASERTVRWLEETGFWA